MGTHSIALPIIKINTYAALNSYAAIAIAAILAFLNIKSSNGAKNFLITLSLAGLG